MSHTVLIVDDYRAFRTSARTMLEDEGFEVVGEAGDGASALELARVLDPDLVLVDIALPDLSGLDVADRLTDARAQIVLTSSRDPADFGARFHATTALGFIPKDDLSGATLRRLVEGRK